MSFPSIESSTRTTHCVGCSMGSPRRSTAIAWFFLDSVDEAKDRNVPLKQALRQIARGIQGYEDRARIVLSGRNTDREFRADLAQPEKQLPVPGTGDCEDGNDTPEKPAEGVETVAQLDVLREMGCDQLQGYLMSKPVPRDAFATLLARGHLPAH